jgi:hypothetical protein
MGMAEILGSAILAADSAHVLAQAPALHRGAGNATLTRLLADQSPQKAMADEPRDDSEHDAHGQSLE